MSYQALARKWRPRRFEEMVGQEHVVRALTHALNHQRLHHAYLFTGTRGVGKTTLARLLAKAMSCLQGVSAVPCGTCAHCLAIDLGRFPDLLEVDAASRTRVEDTRDLLENVQYLPSQGRYKIYIIDEVHMLSTHSFNALLKTLEEPPAHVKFLLATTDPHKLPVTVLSRCLQFHLRRLPPPRICARLAEVSQAEGIPYELAALEQLAQVADGSLRDALSLLDQAIAHGSGSVHASEVAAMLGTLEQHQLHDLLRALAQRDAVGLLAACEQLAAQVPDLGAVLHELALLFHRLAWRQFLPTDETVSADAEFGALFSPEELQLCYEIALHGQHDLPLAPDTRSGVEMTLLRMLAFRPALLTPTPASAQTTSPPPAAPARPAPVTPAQPAARPSTPVTAAENAPEPQAEWRHLIEQLGLSGIALQLAQNCVLIEHSPRRWRLQLNAKHAALLSARTEERLRQAIQQRHGSEIKLEITLATLTTATPAELRAQQQTEQQQQHLHTLQQEPSYRALQDQLDARPLPNTLRPRTS